MGRIESEVMTRQAYAEMAKQANDEVDSYEGEMERVMRAAHVLDAPARNASLQRAAEADEQRRSASTKLAGAFLHDAASDNALSKLSRYEAGFERTFFRSLHELLRLQAARQGGKVQVPAALDVTVHGRTDGK